MPDYGPRIVTDGLVLYLDAANKKSYPGSGTSWGDLTGNGNIATLNGAVFTSSMAGGIAFDGADDTVSMTTDTLLSGNYTIEIAFRRTAFRGDWVRMIGHSNDNSVRFWGLWLPSAYNLILWQSYRSGGEFSVSYPFSLNQDYIISFSNISNVGRVYINGILIGSGATGAINYTGNTSKIIMGFAGFHTYHIGPIYYSKIYNIGLSGDAILQNYNATKTRFGL